MDALLTSLLGCLAGEIGGAGQLLVLALAVRFRRDGPLIAGIILAAIANAALAASAGAFIAPMLGSSARLLFLALALLFLGLGMLWRVKDPDPLTGWPTGPFLTSALGLFILGFGDGSQFLILGISTRTADPVTAAIGGALGVAAAQVPMLLMRDSAKKLRLRAIRRVLGAVLTVIALLLAAAAFHLVG